MAATVLLKDIVDALEMQLDEYSSYLDVETGKVETVSDALLRDAEELPEGNEPDLPKWQREEWELAKLIVASPPSRFKSLPSKFDVHEWSIMEEFAQSVESERIRDELLRAIHGKGAFRYFQDTVRRHGIGKDWDAFRDEALRQIAIEWCEDNEVEWK